MIQIFEIPKPVSANRMWRTGRGRHYTSSAYDDFIRGLDWYVKMQGVLVQPAPLRFELILRGGKGWIISADLDNRIKPTLDALVRCRIIEDDSTQFVKQKFTEYIERPSRSSTLRCFVRLSPPEPSWFAGFDMPAPIAGGAE